MTTLDKTRRLTFLQLNDLHGYLEPHAELLRDGAADRLADMGGLARIATIFDRVRGETEGAVVALDNGDTFHGTFAAVHSRGAAMVEAIDALGFDAMTVHWEFAYGPAHVRELASQLRHPVLAINCFRKASGELEFQPYRVVERAGLRIAVIGLACPIVDKTMPPEYSEGLRFTVGREELPRWIAQCRGAERADLVVVLSHLGFPQDVKMAREVAGIDVLVSGHTHNRMREPAIENGAIIFQSGCHGSFIGRLDVEVSGGRVVSHRHELIEVDGRVDEEPSMKALIERIMAPHRASLGRVIGETAATLDRYAMYQASMDDVLLDAIAAQSGMEIAFSNGWRYGAPIPRGAVTLNDLWNIIPTNPFVSTVELSGAEIRALLESNLERTFAADAFEQMGGYVKRVRGLRVHVKSENPYPHRIERLFVEGRELQPDRTYPVAFVTSQGVPERFGRNRRQGDVRAVDALLRYFERQRPVLPPARRTIIPS
jgi:2',3'-cyclic-nucleotide 2'-phosphodiesterase (5'-nucleotidase family)